MVAGQAIDLDRVRRILAANDSARLRTWLACCTGCGLCAESCFVYLAEGDPKTSPAYKFKATLGRMLKKRLQIDRAFLEECREMAWGRCTMCKRCGRHCPFGVDVSVIIALVRAICFSQGIYPARLGELAENHLRTGNHSAVEPEEWIETCEWMAEEAADEVLGAEIPVERQGARYLYTVNPREPVFHPEELGQAAKIFTLAKESWTVGRSGFDATNLPLFAGHREGAGRAVSLVYDKARELSCEAVLITECGHALRSLLREGPYLAGIPGGKPPLPIVHSIQVFHRYLTEGRLKLDPAKLPKGPVTYQDPCNLSRNGGLSEIGLELAGMVSHDLRPMTPSGEDNHCCGGGAGIIPSGPDWKKARLRNGRAKADQIRATGAEVVLAPCHNCQDQIRDLNQEHGLGVRVMSFKEVIAEAVIIPPEMQPPESAGEGG